jgi:uncharacterized protein involved in type VI secretion and phage assembly
MNPPIGREASAGQQMAGRKYYGVAIGIVTNNQDPENLGRVKVKLPWLSEDHESNWARVCTPMSGKEWGAQFIPEVDDEVLLAFEQGDIRVPYVIGSLYNGTDKPALTNSDGENNQRQIKSRSGHFIVLDDTSGSEKIRIEDKTGSQFIELDSANNAITIKCQGDLTIDAGGKVVFKAGTDVTYESGTNMTVKGGANVTIEATGNLDLKASGMTNVKGAMVNLN